MSKNVNYKVGHRGPKALKTESVAEMLFPKAPKNKDTLSEEESKKRRIKKRAQAKKSRRRNRR